MSIYDLLYEDFKINKPIRLIETFGGIGSQAAALRNIGADFESYRYIEIDKYAVNSYNAIFNTDYQPTDIKNVHADDLGIVDKDDYTYLLTYSFPCQDLSVAGKGKGMKKGSGTRSGLLWEIERILDECTELPQVLLMENVPQVIAEKNIDDFNEWRNKLESLGYKNYVNLLNSKDFEVPQNRNRCFMVSILGDYNYTFPKGKKLKYRLKDILEDDVDEKYYLSEETVRKFVERNDRVLAAGNGFLFKPLGDGDIATSVTTKPDRPAESNYIKVAGYIEKGTVEHQSNTVYSADGVAVSLTATDYKRPQKIIEDVGVKRISGLHDSGDSTRQSGSIYSKDGLSPALDTGSGGFHQPLLFLTVKNNNSKGYDIATVGDTINLSFPSSKTKRGSVGHQIAQTLDTGRNQGVVVGNEDVRIRKLTPRECWRLMGFRDEDFDKTRCINSDTQLYKQAGNSIVVNVLEGIFGKMM